MFLGFQAGLNELDNNKLYIANNLTSTPLIYGEFDNNHLFINESLTTKYFQMTNGATAGYVPVSDATGNMTWTNPTALSITESDPQVSSATTNKVPKWNGTTLTDGTIFDNGNVGIGTTTPSQKLDVNGSINSSGSISSGDNYNFTNTGGTGSIPPQFRLDGSSDILYVIAESNATGPAGTEIRFRTASSATSAADRVTIDKNGNVGIGTTSPARKLDVNGDAYINLLTVGRGSGNSLSNAAFGNLALQLNTSGTVNTAVGTSALYSNTTGADNVGIGANAISNNSTGSFNTASGSYALTNTTGSGNTGFGKNALFTNTTGSNNTALGKGADVASANLTNATAIGYNAVVAVSNAMVLGGTGADAVKVGIGVSSPVNSLDIEGGLAVGATYSGTSTAPSNGAIIQGNVGIGTTTSGQKLSVAGGADIDDAGVNSGTVSNALIFGGGNTGEGIGSKRTATGNQYGLDFYTSSVNRMVIQNGGNVGIATTAPAYKLEVNGTAGKPGGGSWTATSDARMKQDIQPYNDGLAKLLTIKPVTFHYNENSGYDTKPEYVGVIAQDLKEVAPYMVGTFEKEGTQYYNVDNSAMTYMLINAVKELTKKVEEQQKVIDELKKRN